MIVHVDRMKKLHKGKSPEDAPEEEKQNENKSIAVNS